MILSRRCHWLFALLLLLGQHAGVLHQLGHGLADAARTLGVAPAPEPAAAGDLPAADTHSGHCLLCIGFTGLALAPVPAGSLADTALGFARPLADRVGARPLAATGTPIRGPPAAFSVLA